MNPAPVFHSLRNIYHMEAFLDLHRGQTIIMVTHEAEYAKHAHRVISLKDGGFVSDVRQ